MRHVVNLETVNTYEGTHDVYALITLTPTPTLTLTTALTLTPTLTLTPSLTRTRRDISYLITNPYPDPIPGPRPHPGQGHHGHPRLPCWRGLPQVMG